MNPLGELVRERWRALAPTNFATLENQEEFFSELGKALQAEVKQALRHTDALTTQTGDEAARAGHYAALQRQAEEIALDGVPWPADELASTREEWDSTSPHDDHVVEWAWENMGELVFQDELEDLHAKWLLPIEFLERLAAAPNPQGFWDANPQVVEACRAARWKRDIAAERRES
ncbi:hypothetical protein ESZ53_10505 [Salinibacterium sp. UTAS2018]|uniref:hypothetical protein n=1 Tax=Salinibacterium sp. UTAS2018 TaxID=2508880 RepID=UPI00100981CE|nr:hypothetical protein [Salinibacterium sp. UTAS2018]QAV70832.1 hypothetical protein ESZ53_10505 [Salinibacterium sp. UTAS2018]